MDAALSPNGRRLLRVLFFLVVVFLYAPIAILLLFSFNDSVLPTFPLSGFTLTWYRQFVHDSELIGALETSALVALLSSLGAVLLGTLASVALARRRFRGRAAVSAVLLSPLVIPYVVFGIALLLLFHTFGVQRSVVDRGDRAHRDQPAVHDPRARAAAAADRRRARGSRLRPRRRAVQHLSPRSCCR